MNKDSNPRPFLSEQPGIFSFPLEFDHIGKEIPKLLDTLDIDPFPIKGFSWVQRKDLPVNMYVTVVVLGQEVVCIPMYGKGLRQVISIQFGLFDQLLVLIQFHHNDPLHRFHTGDVAYH